MADRAILFIVIAVVVIIANKFDHGEGAIPLFHAITAAWAVCGFKSNGGGGNKRSERYGSEKRKRSLLPCVFYR